MKIKILFANGVLLQVAFNVKILLLRLNIVINVT